MRTSLLAALLISQLAFGANALDGGTSLDAPVTFTDPIYASCPDAPPVVEVGNPDGGTDVKPDGGVGQWLLLPPARAERNACILASCETGRAQEQNANWALVSVVGAGGVVVGAALAIAGAFLLWPKAPPK